MKSLVIYHDHCTDGFGAAFAAWMKFGDEAEYLPLQYGFKTKDLSPDGWLNREVYMLDFSMPRDLMEGLFANAKRVVWLDHHKTAFEMWCGKYEKGMRHTQTFPEDASRICLDDSKSGALLAWEYFHPGTEVPMLIQHIDDRDRWQFKLKGSKELHAALGSLKPWSFKQWSEGLADSDWYGQLWTEGAAILRAQDQHVASMAKQARKCGIPPTVAMKDGYRPGTVFEPLIGLAVNASLHQSEVGHELANQSGTYGLVWRYMADGKVACSLRSNGDYDVSAIAKAFGGGGHRNAAGFETDINTLVGWIK